MSARYSQALIPFFQGLRRLFQPDSPIIKCARASGRRDGVGVRNNKELQFNSGYKIGKC
jgi:hypothetical protein